MNWLASPLNSITQSVLSHCTFQVFPKKLNTLTIEASKSETNNEMSRVAPIPVPVPTVIPIRIGTDAKLEFDKPAKLGGGKGYVFVNQPFLTTLPEGFDVKIGKNEHRVMSVFRNALLDVQQIIRNPGTRKIMLPIGTSVLMDNGVSAAISEPMEVELPDNCQIILPNQTKLQQIDVHTKMTLEMDTPATVVTF